MKTDSPTSTTVKIRDYKYGTCQFHKEDGVLAGEGDILMQCIEKKDKNGQSVYEKDVCNVREYSSLRLNNKYKIVEVIWRCDQGWVCRGYYQGKGKGAYYEIRFSEVNEWEVIGNIYKNPELL